MGLRKKKLETGRRKHGFGFGCFDITRDGLEGGLERGAEPFIHPGK